MAFCDWLSRRVLMLRQGAELRLGLDAQEGLQRLEGMREKSGNMPLNFRGLESTSIMVGSLQ